MNAEANPELTWQRDYPIAGGVGCLGLAFRRLPTAEATQALQNKRELLHQALNQAGCQGPVPELRMDSGAAPQCAGPWTLSLAHSGNSLVAAAAPDQCLDQPQLLGVDIESHRARDFERLGNYLGWTSASRNPGHFYRRWTLAESLFKALGGPQARAWFDALDCALDTAQDDASVRSATLEGVFFSAMWPPVATPQTLCWLLCHGDIGR